MLKSILRFIVILAGIWMLFVTAVSGAFLQVPSLEHTIAVIVYLGFALAFFLVASKLKQGKAFNVKKTTTSLILRAIFIYIVLIICGYVALFLENVFKLQ